MNILFISSTVGWGGAEVWLLQMCRGLTSRGHVVTVVCRKGSFLIDRLQSVRVVGIETLPTWGDFNPISIFTLSGIIKKRKIYLVCTNWEKDLRLGGMASLIAGVPIVPSGEVDMPIKNSAVNRLYYGRIASAIMVNAKATLETMLQSAPWLNAKRMQE